MIGLDLIAAHMVGDYILQSHEVARLKLTDWRIRAFHVTVYSLPFVAVGWAHGAILDPQRWPLFYGLLWVTHFITDSRRWCSGEHWPPRPILVDQTIHLVTLAILARILIGGPA